LKNKGFSVRHYLALFPSKDLMTVLENQNTKAAAIIVFSETQHSEHLIEWKKKFKPQILECQANRKADSNQ